MRSVRRRRRQLAAQPRPPWRAPPDLAPPPPSPGRPHHQPYRPLSCWCRCRCPRRRMRRLIDPLRSRLPRQRQQGCRRLHAYWTCTLTGVCDSCSVDRCKSRHGSSKLQLIIIWGPTFLLHRASSKIARRMACRMHALLRRWSLGRTCPALHMCPYRD